MKQDKKEEIKSVEVKKEETAVSKMRQIVIETDGNDIRVVKAEVSGKIELIGILQNLITHFSNNK